MEAYTRKVQYYETDKMGITHHSNYIRWMEEARIDFLERLGLGYKKLEAAGIVSPVVSVACEYKAPTTFDDTVTITVEVEQFRGVKLALRYTVTKVPDGTTVMLGRSSHCFLDPEGRPFALKKRFPELDAVLKDLAAAAEGNAVS